MAVTGLPGLPATAEIHPHMAGWRVLMSSPARDYFTKNKITISSFTHPCVIPDFGRAQKSKHGLKLLNFKDSTINPMEKYVYIF